MALLWFLVGACLGSFLNVVIYRTPLERSVIRPGSACTCCGTPLRASQKFPLLSFLWLRGRCRWCSSGFSARYLLVELLMGLAGAWLLPTNPALFALLGCSLVVLCTDLEHWIIPDEINLAGVLLGLWLHGSRLDSLAGIGTGLLIFGGIQLVGLLVARQEAMGGGDVKFAAVMGAFLGWKLAGVAFGLSFALGGVYAGLALVGGARGKEPLPFGPFMALAAVLVAALG